MSLTDSVTDGRNDNIVRMRVLLAADVDTVTLQFIVAIVRRIVNAYSFCI
jgi:hypothetical protein